MRRKMLYSPAAKRYKGNIFMRIITGSARGRRLESPQGNDVRPTTDVVKEALFSIIQFDVEGAVFLDAFAGSGQIGLEALSRGAEKAYFVDKSRHSMAVVRKNIEICGFEPDRAVTVSADSVAFLERTAERFDIVFLDPPYMTGLLQRALEAAAGAVRENGIIICEHPREEMLPQQAGGFSLKKEYRYGKIVISIYRSSEL